MTTRPENHEGLGAERLGALVPELAPSLYRFALSVVRDPDAAEDLVQETFLRALERGGQFRGGGSPAGWLRRILHNLAVDRARHLSHEVATEAEDLVGEVEAKWRDDAYTVDAAAVVERAQTREELQDGLVRLPFIYRAAVVLHDVEGWTVPEIARVAGIELPAAKQRLRRGRMMLVTALARGRERTAVLEGVPMRCWDARIKVSDYLDGELPPEERRTLEDHLRSCPTCPPLYGSLVGAREGMGALRDPDTVIPPGLAERVANLVAGVPDQGAP